MRVHPFRQIAFFYLAVLSFALPLHAQTLVAPNANAGVEGNGSNNFPFNFNGGGSVTNLRFQQVYLSSQFAGVGSGGAYITQIAFRPDGMSGMAFMATFPNLQINLSTTSTTPATLSSTFASNVGANNTVVFGPSALTLASTNTGPAGGPKTFDIIINLTTPFLYNPAAGNLLFDIRIVNNGLVTTTPLDSDSSSSTVGFATTVFSGVNSPTADQVSNAGGLITQFTFVPVPEPGALSFFGLAGVGGLVSLLHRRRVSSRV